MPDTLSQPTARYRAPRRSKYTVEVYWPTGHPARPVHAFATDTEAVAFMERVVSQGATIIKCEAPHA